MNYRVCKLPRLHFKSDATGRKWGRRERHRRLSHFTHVPFHPRFHQENTHLPVWDELLEQTAWLCKEGWVPHLPLKLVGAETLSTLQDWAQRHYQVKLLGRSSSSSQAFWGIALSYLNSEEPWGDWISAVTMPAEEVWMTSIKKKLGRTQSVNFMPFTSILLAMPTGSIWTV